MTIPNQRQPEQVSTDEQKLADNIERYDQLTPEQQEQTRRDAIAHVMRVYVETRTDILSEADTVRDILANIPPAIALPMLALMRATMTDRGHLVQRLAIAIVMIAESTIDMTDRSVIGSDQDDALTYALDWVVARVNKVRRVHTLMADHSYGAVVGVLANLIAARSWDAEYTAGQLAGPLAVALAMLAGRGTDG